jgi:hypothetical protein
MSHEHARRRLVLLEGLSLSPSDRDAIVAEFEDFDRALPELERFAEGVPWPALPVQPKRQEA